MSNLCYISRRFFGKKYIDIIPASFVTETDTVYENICYNIKNLGEQYMALKAIKQEPNEMTSQMYMDLDKMDDLYVGSLFQYPFLSNQNINKLFSIYGVMPGNMDLNDWKMNKELSDKLPITIKVKIF